MIRKVILDILDILDILKILDILDFYTYNIYFPPKSAYNYVIYWWKIKVLSTAILVNSCLLSSAVKIFWQHLEQVTVRICGPHTGTGVLLCHGLRVVGGGHGHCVPDCRDLVPLLQSRPL